MIILENAIFYHILFYFICFSIEFIYIEEELEGEIINI